MYVDDPVWIGSDEEWLQNLHVACQYQEVNLSREKLQYARLIFCSLLPSHHEVMIRDIIHSCQRLQVRVIAHDTRDLHAQLAAFPAPQQVGKAVVQFGYEDGDPLTPPQVMHA